MTNVLMFPKGKTQHKIMTLSEVIRFAKGDCMFKVGDLVNLIYCDSIVKEGLEVVDIIDEDGIVFVDDENLGYDLTTGNELCDVNSDYKIELQ